MTDLTAVGVHVFAGGFSLGIGPYFTVTDHLEGAATWERTVKHNLPTVRQWNPKTQWPVDRLRKDPPALLYANPPCAPFSSIGGRSFGRHWSVDPRLGCWEDVVGLVEVVRPTVVLSESVPAIESYGKPFLDTVVRRLGDAGYGVTVVRHNAKFYGLPQSRQRTMGVASLVRLDWPLPLPVRVTVGDALVGLADPGLIGRTPEYWEELLPAVLPGEKLRSAIARLGVTPPAGGKVNFISAKLDPTTVAGAIVRSSLYHWTEPRRLGLNEFKRLSGYPDDFEMIPPEPKFLFQAVLPPVARWFSGVAHAGITRGAPSDTGGPVVLSVLARGRGRSDFWVCVEERPYEFGVG